MNNRTKNKSQMNLALEDLELHYQDFENDFILFFKDIQKFASYKYIQINTL